METSRGDGDARTFQGAGWPRGDAWTFEGPDRRGATRRHSEGPDRGDDAWTFRGPNVAEISTRTPQEENRASGDDAFDDGATDASDASASDDDVDDAGADDPTCFGCVGPRREVALRDARLGMTLENVLEQTVVHEVDERGAARQAGLRAGDVVVDVGGEACHGSLHDEVIERLRKPRRPLILGVRSIAAETLARRRREARTYVRRADMSPMNRSDDAAATWLFRGDRS